MEHVIAKSVNMGFTGFLISSGFVAFQRVDEYVRFKTLPGLQHLHDVRAAESLTHTDLVAEGARVREASTAASTLRPKERFWSALERAAFDAPRLPPPSRAMHALFADTAPPSRLRLTAQVTALACAEGLRSGRVLLMGTALAGIIGFARHGRAEHERIFDVHRDPLGASAGVALGLYMFSRSDPRFSRLLIAAVSGVGLYSVMQWRQKPSRIE